MEEREGSSSPNTLKRYIAELGLKPVIITALSVSLWPTVVKQKTRTENIANNHSFFRKAQLSVKLYGNISVCLNQPQTDRLPMFLTRLLEQSMDACSSPTAFWKHLVARIWCLEFLLLLIGFNPHRPPSACSWQSQARVPRFRFY